MKSVRHYRKFLAVALALLQLLPVFWPATAYALTGGPSAPEVQQFTPAENTEMVNLFTGDFSYQVPLLDVGGYPLTLGYSSNVGMESEAGMVGLGWNLNTGSIARDVRGLPDDFNGQAIQITRSAKPEEVTAFGAGLDVEILGANTETNTCGECEVNEYERPATIGAKLTMEHNTYDGWSAGFGIGGSVKGKSSGSFKASGKLSVGISGNSAKGSDYNIGAGVGFGAKINGGNDGSIGGGLNYALAVNSRQGIKKNSFGADISYKNTHTFGESGSAVVSGVGFEKGEFKGGGKFNIGYASPTMSPTIDWPMYEDGFAGDLTVGGEIGGAIALSGTVEFSYRNSRYAHNYEAVPAYGYMYAQNATGGRESMDVLREKGSSFSKDVPNLPMSQFAHDMFSVNVQGIQTTFRPFRGDIGTLYDPSANSVSVTGSLGAEVGAGDLLKLGVNIKVPVQYAQSSKWTEGNEFNNRFRFQGQVESNPLYEAVYFKSMGEATAMANPQQFTSIGDFRPVRPTVNADGNTTADIIDNNVGPTTYTDANLVRQNREYRQNNFSYLTVREAAAYGFNRSITTYPINMFSDGGNTTLFNSRIQNLPRERRGGIADQISEVTVTRTDGTRFVFSIPAYNDTSTDVSFNISGNVKGPNGFVAYRPGIDNSTANNRGENNVFDKETTPPHAYAWMLTDMLSADYVDLTGNGPTADDLGSYTKFNYTLATDNYKWRVPVQQDSAVFKEGAKSDDKDDMANYSYGVKQLWYVHSIETKNYIAEFTYSDRDDAVGVKGENGGLSTDANQRMKKLDKIELYTKASRLMPGAVPVKTVHFVYDYSLCRKVPNNINNGGKLTLKRVWFEYGSSEKGSRNPYLFTYSETNPNYNTKKFDRWGNYISSESGDEGLKTYASLTKENADNCASAWLLTKIATPSGSVLNITYETKDYAYVQNRTAMEMVQVTGFTNAAGKLNARGLEGDDPTAELYDNSNNVNNYLQFKLKQPVSSNEAVRPYVEGISELYFSMNVRMSNPAREDAYEKAEGFIPVNLQTAGTDYGVCSNDSFGWIRLPQMHNGDEMRDMNTPANDMTFADGVHPVSKAAWETIRKKFMNLIYNEPVDAHSPEALGTALENCFQTLAEMFRQANLYLRDGHHANRAKLKSAKVRLNSPDLIKFGGGARVKKISISDEWGNMVQDPSLNFSYGKEYSYTTDETVNGAPQTISSGVAQYEPASGNEENPFVLPYRYAIEKPLSVDFNVYLTGPVGQIYFPSPVIGYSKVTVKQLMPEGAPASGYAVNQFYTSKDFPTVVRTTDLKVSPREIQVPPFYSEDHINATQGFSVELNDMHGKQKGTYQYAPLGTMPVSGTFYRYSTSADNPSQLNNTVSTVNGETGSVTQEIVGVDYDFFADAREHQQHTMLPEAQINLDMCLRGPAPVIIPTVYPGYTHSFGRLRVQTFNKVVYRSGLLEETVAFDNGAQISTSNLVRDRESGEVVLQDVKNEFNDNRYILTYPARWVAESRGMNGAYRNAQLRLNTIPVNDGVATVTNAAQYLQQGDEVICITPNGASPSSTDGSTFGRADVFTTAWVMNTSGNAAYLIDRAGDTLPNGTYNIRVVRSGYRNIVNATAGKFQFNKSPLQAGQLAFPSGNVLASQVIEHSNHWQVYGLFESSAPVYSCRCAHAQVGKRNAVDILGELVNSLLTKGDYKRSAVAISPSYSTGASFFTPRFGNRAVTYNGMLSGSMVQGAVVPYGSTDLSQQCELDIRMADGSLFPDTVVSFTIDSRTFNDGDGDCNDIYTATGTVTYLGPATYTQNPALGATRPRLTARVTITSCIPLADCETRATGTGQIRCMAAGRTKVNPFVSGILGSWHQLNEWVYATTYNPTSNLRSSGTYADYEPFFHSGFPLRIASRSTDTKWAKKTSSIAVDNYGRVIESKDAVGNYHAELYGYGLSLPVAVADNAEHGQIAFDGFEDYNFRNQINNPFSSCPLPSHFKPSEFDALNRDTSHTGMYSLPVASGVTVARNYAIHYDRPFPATDRSQYTSDRSVLISPFSPTPGKEFFVSAWVKKNVADASTSSAGGGGNLLQQLSQSILPGSGTLSSTITGSGIAGALSGDLIVKARNSAGTETTIGTFSTDGNAVDGWYQVNGKFTVPMDAQSITVEMRARGGKVWFDDLRIQPFNSVMKTFVFHPVSLRLMAVLDENNYATFYVYDKEEHLVATKKETEDGIFTVQEARSGTSKITRP